MAGDPLRRSLQALVWWEPSSSKAGCYCQRLELFCSACRSASSGTRSLVCGWRILIIRLGEDCDVDFVCF